MTALFTIPDRPMPNAWKWILSAGSSFLFFGVVLVVFGIVQPDLDDHIAISNRMWTGFKIPAHPLFYTSIQILSFFSQDFKLEVFAAFLVFAAAQTLKIQMAGRLLEAISGKALNYWAYFGVFTGCWIINPTIWEPHFILNQIEPNFYHNGTLQVCLPFALWLIREIFEFVENEKPGAVRYMMYAGLLTGIGKPSLLFCVIPMLPVYALWRRGLSRTLLQAIQVSLVFTFLIMGQSMYLRFNPPNYVTSFKVLVKPFYQFGGWIGHMKMLFYSSLVPMVFLLANRSALRNPFFLFLMACHLFGLGIAITFVDTLNGVMYNNMTWQSSITLLLLVLFSIGMFYQNPKSPVYLKVALTLLLVADLGYFAWYIFQAYIYKSFFI